ncbi:MAG: hypothetical protein JWP12_1638 [Bacteroidetes bacterium]|nr:hypothetical protein [Bacteroidota bacterium]
MQARYKTGNIVKFMFGKDLQYIIIGTKENPIVPDFLPLTMLPDGYDYFIRKIPIDEFSPLLPVFEQHLELISEK